MQVICGWCKTSLRDEPTTGPNDNLISHGMCDACSKIMIETYEERKEEKRLKEAALLAATTS